MGLSLSGLKTGASRPTPLFCEDGRVKVWTLPAIEQAACTVHRGDYRDIGQAYGALTRWLEANGYAVAGPVRAVYLELGARRSTHGPEVTELQLPVVFSQSAKPKASSLTPDCKNI